MERNRAGTTAAAAAAIQATPPSSGRNVPVERRTPDAYGRFHDSHRDYATKRTPASRRPHSVDVLEMSSKTATSASDYWSSEEKYAQQVRQSAAAVATPRVSREEDISRDVKESALWSYVQPRGRNGQVNGHFASPKEAEEGEEHRSLRQAALTPPRGRNGQVRQWSVSQENLLEPRGRIRQGMVTPPRGDLNGEVMQNVQGLTPTRGLNGEVMKAMRGLTPPRSSNGEVSGWSSSQENLLGARMEVTGAEPELEAELELQQQQQQQQQQQFFNRSLSARLPRGAKSPVTSPTSDVMDNKRFEQVSSTAENL